MADTLTEAKNVTISRSPHAAIVVVDFGSQYSMLIARRIRELNTYCEVIPYNAEASTLDHLDVRGFVLSGGPNSVYDEGAPHAADWVFESGRPVLGICYGMQLLAEQLGGKVGPGREREFGPATISASGSAPLLAGLPTELDVWMSHGDRIEAMPPGFASLATSENSPVAVMADVERGYYGLQFHPEVVHTPRGGELIANYVRDVCGGGGGLDAGQLRRGNGGDHPRAGRRRAGYLRPLRRRRQRRGGDARAPRYRRPADLHLRRQRAAAARGKRRRWSTPSSAT